MFNCLLNDNLLLEVIGNITNCNIRWNYPGEKVYTIEEIKEMIYDILKKYGIEKAYIFGSYARGEANQQSDVDIMIKKGNLKTLLQLSALAYEIEQILKKQIDIVIEETYTKDTKYDSDTIKLAKNIFYNEVKKERLNIYE